jgi:hypothetical protein
MKRMCEYKHNQGRPKWKALKGSNAKTQAKATRGGKGAKEEIKELGEPLGRRT